MMSRRIVLVTASRSASGVVSDTVTVAPPGCDASTSAGRERGSIAPTILRRADVARKKPGLHRGRGSGEVCCDSELQRRAGVGACFGVAAGSGFGAAMVG